MLVQSILQYVHLSQKGNHNIAVNRVKRNLLSHILSDYSCIYTHTFNSKCVTFALFTSGACNSLVFQDSLKLRHLEVMIKKSNCCLNVTATVFLHLNKQSLGSECYNTVGTVLPFHFKMCKCKKKKSNMISSAIN